MPRKLTAAAFLSLDGIIKAPGGPTEDPTGGFEEGGWVFKLWDEVKLEITEGLTKSVKRLSNHAEADVIAERIRTHLVPPDNAEGGNREASKY